MIAFASSASGSCTCCTSSPCGFTHSTALDVIVDYATAHDPLFKSLIISKKVPPVWAQRQPRSIRETMGRR